MIKELYSLVIMALMILIHMESLYALFIMNSLQVDEEKIPSNWFKLIDRDRDLIDDALEDVLCEDSIVRAIVILSSPPTLKHMNLLQLLGAKIIRGPWIHAVYGFSIEIDSSKILDLRNRLLALDVNRDGYSDLLFIQGVHRYSLSMHYSSRHTVIRPLVWDLGVTGRYVGIAVLDSGVDIYAPGIPRSSEKISGYDATNSREWYVDEFDHGTHVVYTLVGSYNGSEGLLPLSSEFINNISSGMDSINIFLKYPIPVFSLGRLYVDIYTHVYDPSFSYEAYLCKVPGYADPLQAIYMGDIQCMVSNSTWDNLGNGIGRTRLELLIDNMSGYGNYLIGLRHNYVDSISAWINTWAPSIISSDQYNLSIGIAPDSKILMIRVVDKWGNLYTDYIVDGIDYVLSVMNQYNISIVNMSFEGQGYDAALELALLNAFRSGLVLVASAGNRGASNSVNGKASNAYPAAFPWVISVVAVDGFNNITYYSSQGGYSTYDNETLKPDVAAPGGGGAFQVYTADSNNEDDFYFEDDIYDLSIFNGTSASAAIVSGLAALVVDLFRSKEYNSTHSLWEKLLEINSSEAVLIVKGVIEASTYETYPLIRSFNGTNLYQYSPTLERGSKDIHEGFGVIDGYAAIRIAGYLADLLLYKLGSIPQYPYDYGLNDNIAPFIEYTTILRNGTLYNVSDIPYNLNFPFNSSVDGIAVHFERIVYSFNGTDYPTVYGIRLIADTEDQLNTDFDAHVYLLNNSAFDIQLLNHTVGGMGLADETMYFQPPSKESNYNEDFIYIITVKRAIESSAGGKALLYIGPGLTARFTNGKYIWFNATAVTPPSIAKYAILIIYYSNSSGTYIHRVVVLNTSDLNEFANVNGYIDIGYGLEDDYSWYVGIIFTRDRRSINNLTRSSIVEGPVAVKIEIGEPVSLELLITDNVYDHMDFNITARLICNDTGKPIGNETIYFYKSSYLANNLENYTLIGTATTNSSGYAVLTWNEPDNGTYYYVVEYQGSNDTQYSVSIPYPVDVYMRTIIEMSLSSNSIYTVEPVTLNVSLKKYFSNEPLSGEQVDIWLSYDNGTSWNLLYSGITNSQGQITYTHIFMVENTYMLKANYSGNSLYLLLSNESLVKTLYSIKTPISANISYNGSFLKVYDTIVFSVQVNYTYNSVMNPLQNATIYLELWNNGTWITIDNATTDQLGYASLTYTISENGTYGFRIHYNGNDTFKEFISQTYWLDIHILSTTVEILAVPTTGYINQTLSAVVLLVDEKNRPIPNETIKLLKLVNHTWILIDSKITNSYGETVLQWSEISEGNYTYKIVYEGRDRVYSYAESNIFNITIYRISTGIVLSINTSMAYVNETIMLKAHVINNVSKLVGETIIFQKLVNGSWIDIGFNTIDENGYAILIYYEEYAGNYMYRAYYPGSELFYESISNNVTIRIRPIPTTITLNIPSIEFATETVVIEVYLETHDGRPLTGYNIFFWISLDGSKWTLLGTNKTDPMGRAIYNHEFWIADRYYIKAVFIDPGITAGKQVYNGSETIGSIQIVRMPIEITLSVNNTNPYINESVLLVTHIKSIHGRPIYPTTLFIYLNNTVYYILQTDKSGYSTIVLKNNAYIIMNAYVEYMGNATYNTGISNVVTITWNPLPISIELYSSTMTTIVGNNFTLIAYVIDQIYGEPVINYSISFWKSIDGVSWTCIGYNITNSSGYAYLTIAEKIQGQYYYRAIFTDPYSGVEGKWIYQSGISNIVSINILSQIPTSIELILNSSREYVGKGIKLIAYLENSITGDPLIGYEVVFYLYSRGSWIKIGRSVTNNTGYACLDIAGNNTGKYVFKAVFHGSHKYSGSVSNIVSMEYITNPLLIEVLKIYPLNPVVGDTIYIIVKLTSLSSIVENKMVILYRNGEVLSIAKTNSSGIALLYMIPYDAGMYDLYIVSPQDNLYNGSMEKINIIVRNNVYIELDVSYIPLSNGSVLFRLVAKLKINNEPFIDQLIRFYKYSNGSWILIGENTTNSNGMTILTYLDKISSQTVIFSAKYEAVNETLVSASTMYKLALPEHAIGINVITIALIIIFLLAILIHIRHRRLLS